MVAIVYEPVDSYVSANGVRLHYLEWGNESAPTVILLHGLSSNCHNWDFLCSALAGDYHLFAIDQRGHGDSDKPEAGYQPADYVADLAAFRAALRLGRFSLIGHSMGGRVSVLYASEAGQAVAGLVLVDSGPGGARAGIERVTQNIVNAPDSFADEREAYAHIKSLRPRYSHETLQNRVRHALRRLEDGRLTWKYDRGALLETLHSAADLDWWDRLAKVACPTLLIRGGESDILKRETAQRMTEVLASCHLVEIPESTHAVPFEDTVHCETAIRRFLAEHGG